MTRLALALLAVAALPASAFADDTGLEPDRSDLMAAAVRIRVIENESTQVGSGTIIQSEPGHALILTCAHIMDRAGNDALIEVDVFSNDEGRIFLGEIVGHHIDSDVGLISIRPKTMLPFASIDFSTQDIATGDEVMSIGCNHGARPTPMHVSVRDVNLYVGADHLICEKAPKYGRSGGGLFDRGGRLIGVCSAANRKLDHGLYAGRAAIHDMLERHDMFELVRAPLANAKVRTASHEGSPDAPVRTATGEKPAVEQR